MYKTSNKSNKKKKNYRKIGTQIFHHQKFIDWRIKKKKRKRKIPNTEQQQFHTWISNLIFRFFCCISLSLSSSSLSLSFWIETFLLQGCITNLPDPITLFISPYPRLLGWYFLKQLNFYSISIEETTLTSAKMSCSMPAIRSYHVRFY